MADADEQRLDMVDAAQQAGSQLARMAICGPLLTGFVAEAWFAPQHDLRKRIEVSRQFSFIPFTLPGQPESYVLEEPAQTFSCPCLEAALDVYRLERGEYPPSLQALVDTRLVSPSDLRYPWQDAYYYRRVAPQQFILLPPLR